MSTGDVRGQRWELGTKALRAAARVKRRPASPPPCWDDTGPLSKHSEEAHRNSQAESSKPAHRPKYTSRQDVDERPQRPRPSGHAVYGHVGEIQPHVRAEAGGLLEVREQELQAPSLPASAAAGCASVVPARKVDQRRVQVAGALRVAVGDLDEVSQVVRSSNDRCEGASGDGSRSPASYASPCAGRGTRSGGVRWR